MTTAKQIVDFCRQHNIHFVFAESCTGGKLAAAIVDVPGASDVFHGSLVTYSDGMKMAVLDVEGYTLGRFSAVSEIVAHQMAYGALHLLRDTFSHTQPDVEPRCFTVSTTGYVGPFTDENRHAFIGLAGFFASQENSYSGFAPAVHEITFKTDDRQGNQQAVVERALQEIVTMLEKATQDSNTEARAWTDANGNLHARNLPSGKD